MNHLQLAWDRAPLLWRLTARISYWRDTRPRAWTRFTRRVLAR